MKDNESFAEIMLKASSIMFIFLVIQRLFGYFFNSLLAKSFSQVDYGSYTFAWSIAMFLCGILLLGVGPATSRYVAYYRGKNDINRVNSVIKTGFMMILSLISISLLAIIVINRYDPSMLSLNQMMVLFVCIVFATHGIGYFFSAVVSGYRRPEIGNFFATLFPVLSVAFSLVLVWFGCDFSCILAGIATAFVLSNLACSVFALKNYGLKGSFHPDTAKKLLMFGIPITFIDTANNLLSWADLFIIKFYRGFSDLSVYWASTINANIILMFSMPVISIFSPIVAELYGKKDTERLGFMSSYMFERFLVLSLPILVVFLVFPKGILLTVFNENYVGGALPMQILSVSTFILGLSMIFRTLITASGRPQQEGFIISAAAIVNVILNLILIKPYGIVGASAATLFSSLLIFVLSFIYARRIVKVVVYRDRIVKISISLIVAMFLVYVVKILFPNIIIALIISAFVLALSYSVSLILLKALRKEDVVLVSMVIEKMKVPGKIEALILKFVRIGTS